MRGCIKERNNRECPERPRLWTVVGHVGEARGPADFDHPTADPALIRLVENHMQAHQRRAGQDLAGASHPPAHRRYQRGSGQRERTSRHRIR